MTTQRSLVVTNSHKNDQPPLQLPSAHTRWTCSRVSEWWMVIADNLGAPTSGSGSPFFCKNVLRDGHPARATSALFRLVLFSLSPNIT